MFDKAIIYPIANGNYKDSNHELILSLRSIEKYLLRLENLPELEIPVIVISEECPPYLSDKVVYVKCDGYKDAMFKACQLAKEFLWMNDDISLLRPHVWDEFKMWSRGENPIKPDRIEEMIEGTGWSKRKGQVLKQLHEAGDTTYDYSSHTPYLYEGDKLLKILKEFEFGWKTPFETAYGNRYHIERNPSRNKLSRHHDKALPVNMEPYTVMNTSDAADLPHTRGFLLGKFPEPCDFESYGNLETDKLTFCTIK